ncbi:hypothetical protein OIHEL45_02110 [Sulfitobacter indolifex HEL-45]|uniref:Uncharacterized protein n=1 Tax=Sulfitobacter indolifex HEL-45 TaxID=391624 RepID=A0ABP2DCA6_9RHOB|nr:hypothetical protein OIHEL45_02110 [Sulfitobacter indolifex HEL-45]
MPPDPDEIERFSGVRAPRRQNDDMMNY